jgi:hypothetical protein
MKRLPELILPILVFLVVFAAYFRSPVLTSFDSRWSIHTAMSIIREGNTNLDEYRRIIPPDDQRVRTIDGHLYAKFPLGPSLIALPFVLIIYLLSGRVISFDLVRFLANTAPASRIELFVACFVVALAAAFVHLAARLLLRSDKQALVIVFVFAFCTSAWSLASRALWQHGPTMLMLALALYLVLLAKERPWIVQLASLPLAFSYIVRPTNAISIFALTLFVLVQHRRYFLLYLAWGLVIAAPFLAFDLRVYHTLWSWYYLALPIGTNRAFLDAAAANLVSPARGLFFFSPILLFSIYGIVIKVRRREFEMLDGVLLAIIVTHWIVISSWPLWWAGHSFGPRFFSDMIPYFAYFLAPAVKHIASLRGWRKAALVSAFACLAAASFAINLRGAADWATWEWNARPVDIDARPSRVWDWRDIQFLRGM